MEHAASMSRRDLGRRVGWLAVCVAAAAAVVVCFLPAVEIRIEASIGAGAEQLAFSYDDRLSIALDAAPFGLLPVAGGLFLLAVGAVGALRRPPGWLVLASFVVAACLALLVYDTEDQRLGWVEEGGVVGYETDNGGPVLGPGLDDLHAEAEASPEAQRPGWELLGGDHGYASRGLTAWRVFLWSSLALVWLTGYQFARLRFRPVPALLLVAAATVVMVIWILLRSLSSLS